jgi:hypothetical protein
MVPLKILRAQIRLLSALDPLFVSDHRQNDSFPPRWSVAPKPWAYHSMIDLVFLSVQVFLSNPPFSTAWKHYAIFFYSPQSDSSPLDPLQSRRQTLRRSYVRSSTCSAARFNSHVPGEWIGRTILHTLIPFRLNDSALHSAQHFGNDGADSGRRSKKNHALFPNHSKGRWQALQKDPKAKNIERILIK